MNKKYIIYGYFLFFGIMLGYCGINYTNWRWWVIVIPTVAIVTYSNKKGKEVIK